MGDDVPCTRADHADGVWSRFRMPWSGTRLRATAPIEVKVEHRGRQDVTLASGTLVEAVGRAYDPWMMWGIDLLFVRGGPLGGECVTVRGGTDDDLPWGFDLAGLLPGIDLDTRGRSELRVDRCPRDHTLPVEELGYAKGDTWVADRDLSLWSAHLEHGRLAPAAGTRLRNEQSVTAASIWFPTVLFRLFALDGPHAGAGVWLETDERADLTRVGLRRATTPDEFWTMGPGQVGSEQFRCRKDGSTTAHLFAYAGTGDDPDYPRCGIRIPSYQTRPAAHGDDRCRECEDWYAYHVYLPQIG